jgi:hypothetical protein
MPTTGSHADSEEAPVNCLRPVSLLAACLLLAGTAAAAPKPATNACTVLPVARVGKIFGQPFHILSSGENAPQSHSSALGSQCNYLSRKPWPGAAAPLEVSLTVYVESSPAVARTVFADNRAFLVKTSGPTKAVAGLGDAAFRDAHEALHVRKGKAHFDLIFQTGLTWWKVTPKNEPQERDVATWVLGHL